VNDAFDAGLSRNFLSRAFLQLPYPWASYRLVIDDAGQPLDALILQVNDAFAARSGLDAPGFTGRTVREVMADDPAGADSRIALFARATLDRKTVTYEEYLASADKWYRVSVTSPEFLHFMTLGVDITDWKRAEIREQECATRLRAFMDNAPLPLFVTDSEGRYIDVNPASCSLVGYTREELLSRSIPDLVPPERIEGSFRAFETLKTEGRLSRETRLCRKDGSCVDVSLLGVHFEDGTYLAYCEDLGESRRLDRVRDRLLSVFLAVDRPIFLLDPTGAIIEANERFLGLFGYSRPELSSLGATFLDPGLETCQTLGYEESEYRKLYGALWRDVKDPRIRFWDGVLPNRKKDGSLFWNHLVLRGMFTVDGALDSIAGFPAEIPTSPLYDARD